MNKEEKKEEKNIKEMVFVNLDQPEEDSIDLFNVFSFMGKKKRLISYLLVLAILVGIAGGVLFSGYEHLSGKGSYARALITFQFDGIEKGLSPTGASFDVTLNMIRSPYVIQKALKEVGLDSESNIEAVRENLELKGIVPEDAVQKISVIEKMAEKDATQYEKILDVSYYPSQYLVYLYDDGTFSPNEMTNILNQIISQYKQYFLDTYANATVMSVTSNLLDAGDYDYGESVDLVRTQIRIMQSYVNEKLEEAPDFRSATTGLSYQDIVTALQFVRSVDLARLSSFVETHSLTKDKQLQIEYYEYRIREISNTFSEYQSQLETIQNAIDTYEKDPVVIVSGTDSTLEYGEKGEYYDSLITRKISITAKIAETNTELNEYYLQLNNLRASDTKNTQAEYDYADGLLAKMDETISSWVEQIEQTTEEYYETTKYSDAVSTSVPAQYFADGGLSHIVKNMIVPVGALVGLVLIWWFYCGVKQEIVVSRQKDQKKEEQE